MIWQFQLNGIFHVQKPKVKERKMKVKQFLGTNIRMFVILLPNAQQRHKTSTYIKNNYMVKNSPILISCRIKTKSGLA